MADKFKVDGISMFARVHDVNPITVSKDDPGKFTMELLVDLKDSKTLTDLGLRQARREDGSPVAYEEFPDKMVFRFKRSAKLGPPVVADSQRQPTKVLIGNGSKVRVYGSAYEYKTKAGRTGVAAGLEAVQVIELAEFAPNGAEFTAKKLDEIPGGFVSKEPVKEAVKNTDSEPNSDVENFFDGL